MSDPRSIALGWLPDEGCFRLLAPLAEHVELIERHHPAREPQRITAMRRISAVEVDQPTEAIWQADVSVPLGCYRFRVHLVWGTVVICDPRSKAVVRRKMPGHPGWSVATPTLPPANNGVTIRPDAAVLLEVHLADATCHHSSGATAPGTYGGFAEMHAAAVGGARHAIGLGVDAIELLPVTTWPVFEDERVHHRNHWGYMPSFFLSVSDRFSAAWTTAQPGDWVGMEDDGSFHDPALELRAMVDALHAEGVGVVVDLVYNHVSAHDHNPLLLLDPGTWFHRDSAGRLRSHSGCGNDLNTSTPAMRALVVASIRRWFAEIGVDGVRLDLAELLDDQTLIEIRDAARAIRPDALLIAEPWSLGGYRPAQIAALGWTVWDDRYRNGLKGAQPGDSSLLSPLHSSSNDAAALARHLVGGGQEVGGHLPTHNHGLSYLAAHDGYTLADFWRLHVGELGDASLVQARSLTALSPSLQGLLRLSAAVLLATRGPVMMHLGQSWGRAKVRRRREDEPGILDHNSYDRDDLTNYIDWTHRSLNAPLVAWVHAWLEARKLWLAPVFAVEQSPVLLIDADAGAAGYLMACPVDSDAVQSASPSALPAVVRHVAFGANPGATDAHLELPGHDWQTVLAESGVWLQTRGQEGTVLHLPPGATALVKQEPA